MHSLLWLCASAWAAPDIDVATYRPSVDAQSMIFTDDAGRLSEGWGGGARVFANYQKSPLVRVSDGERTAIVNDLLVLDLLGAVTYRRVRLGLHLPVIPVLTSQSELGGGGVGDLSLDGRVTLLEDGAAPVGLALAGRLQLPTSTVSAPVGGAGVQWEATGVVDHWWEDLHLATNLGWHGARSVSLDGGGRWGGALLWRIGLSQTLAKGRAGVGVEHQWRGVVGFAQGDASSRRGAGAIAEVLGNGWLKAGPGRVFAGLGAGLSVGIGAPAVHGLVGFCLGPSPQAPSAG